jgi:hypothetical protein
MMRVVIAYGGPAAGLEREFFRAWKHRQEYMRLALETPWWQFGKKRRRFDGWSRALERTKRYGADVVYELSK